MRRMVFRLEHRDTLRAFDTWVDFSAHMRDSEDAEAEERKKQEEAEQKRVRAAIEVPGHLAGGVELALGEAGHLALGFAAHVPHYLSQVLFPQAAVALLEEVGVAGSLSFDLSELELKAQQAAREINEQLAGNTENEQAVRDLEMQYDEIVRGAANALPLATDGPLPSGDDIAAQFQEFLRELDDDKGRSE
jgi:hypothetical protein